MARRPTRTRRARRAPPFRARTSVPKRRRASPKPRVQEIRIVVEQPNPNLGIPTVLPPGIGTTQAVMAKRSRF